MCTAVIFLIPRTGANGTLKPCWKGRSIPNARFAVLKRQAQLLRTEEDTKNNNRLSVPGTKRTCQVGAGTSPALQPRRAASIAATSIFPISIIAAKARLASSPPAASASVSTRGVICQEIPHLSLHHPHWLSCPPLPTIAFQ